MRWCGCYVGKEENKERKKIKACIGAHVWKRKEKEWDDVGIMQGKKKRKCRVTVLQDIENNNNNNNNNGWSC